MIIVVRESDRKILARYEAWATGAYEHAMADIDGNGHTYLREEITVMGDMVIYVR